jgi:DMSO/TMAO reductase YedYZ molybdopterin-dependent catalytic subunit
MSTRNQLISSWTGARVTPPFDRKIIEPTPSWLMENTGTGLDYGTRPDRMPGYLVPNDRFFIRSHAATRNGEPLPADHGFPARVVVSGWLGAASIKWLDRIEVSEQHLYVPWNTEDYVLIGPRFPANDSARGVVITSLPVATLVELPWPARLRPEPQMIRGRAFAGQNAVATVEHRRRSLAICGTGLP